MIKWKKDLPGGQVSSLQMQRGSLTTRLTTAMHCALRHGNICGWAGAVSYRSHSQSDCARVSLAWPSQPSLHIAPPSSLAYSTPAAPKEKKGSGVEGVWLGRGMNVNDPQSINDCAFSNWWRSWRILGHTETCVLFLFEPVLLVRYKGVGLCPGLPRVLPPTASRTLTRDIKRLCDIEFWVNNDAIITPHLQSIQSF